MFSFSCCWLFGVFFQIRLQEHILLNRANNDNRIVTHHSLTNVGGAQYDSSSSSNQRVWQWSEQIVKKNLFQH